MATRSANHRPMPSHPLLAFRANRGPGRRRRKRNKLEKSVLLALVEKYKDFKQLKKCWENIKARTKKIMAHERREKGKLEVPEANSICADGSPPQSIGKAFPKGDLELLIDEQGKIQAEPIRKVPVTESLCAQGSPSGTKKKSTCTVGESSLHSTPAFSSSRISANRTYGRKPSQNGIFTKMHEEQHHQQMSILQLQLIQMNEVHVAKVQADKRERKLQTITKEWPVVASFNRPFPNSP
ncbi:hypothetical protein GDO86_011420 [Hymenochirus boettgeri]|uniref:Uncharacterized protein n=1 Tax=Hymenochirus boettgeri TaxID=247094 RepID=A0A8T2JJG2_9PIPI|nr:hypothetical protein GDO86_011420 [Hymenochirus boettgeri]